MLMKAKQKHDTVKHSYDEVKTQLQQVCGLFVVYVKQEYY